MFIPIDPAVLDPHRQAAAPRVVLEFDMCAANAGTRLGHL